MIYRLSHTTLDNNGYLSSMREEKSSSLHHRRFFLPLPFIDPGGSTRNVWSYISMERPFRIPTRCTRPRTVKSSPSSPFPANPRKNADESPAKDHHPRKSPSSIRPHTCRRSLYVVNNINIMQSGHI